MDNNNDDGLAIFADINDALVWVVHKLGGYKKVGALLRPELEAREGAAGQWLRDCLNPEKRERLNPDQTFLLLQIARQKGFHAAKHWLDDRLGYERGRALTVEDEAARLARTISDATHILRDSLDRLERLNKTPMQVLTGDKS